MSRAVTSSGNLSRNNRNRAGGVLVERNEYDNRIYKEKIGK